VLGSRQATFPSRLTTLRYRVTRDSKRTLHFLHLGKTGGTAFKHALLDHRAVRDYRLLLHGHDVLLADVPVGEKVMFIVRDPVSRFVSAFNGRIREDRPRYHYPWKPEERIAFGIFTTPDQLGRALSADDEVEREHAERAMRGIGHVAGSYWHWFGDELALRSRLPDLFLIAFQEQLDDDFELLKRKLGLPQEVRLPRDATVAHRTPAGFDQDLGEVARGNLERWYKRDLAFVQLCRELAPLVNDPPVRTVDESRG
jgi:hypothetical protein